MIKHAENWVLYAMIGGVILLVGAMMVASAQPASAQCGTSASSCKSCHETQGQMSVANNGDWHKAHAFGDFCEFCHAGNVQAKDKAAAHEGMVAPLGDVKASCQGCHPDDYNPLAEKYAAVLGVKLDAGGSSGASGGATGSGPSTGNNTGCVAGASVSAPTGGEQIDYNLLYTEATTPPPLVSNWGNVILGLLIVGTAGAFFVTAWSWEHWGQKVGGWINQNIAPIPQAVAAASARSDSGVAMTQALAADNMSQVEALLAQKPTVQALLPRLMNLPPETLASLSNILSNPERGSEILSAVSKVDADIIATLRQLGAKERNLLLALFKQ
jgi:hypothetical protein